MDIKTIIGNSEEKEYMGFEEFWIQEQKRDCFNINNYKFLVSSFYEVNYNWETEKSTREYSFTSIMYIIYRDGNTLWSNEGLLSRGLDGQLESNLSHECSKLYEGEELIKFLKENKIGEE